MASRAVTRITPSLVKFIIMDAFYNERLANYLGQIGGSPVEQGALILCTGD